MAKFTISKSELLTRLQSASKIISSKPVYPIMSCFLFEVKENQLLISSADSLGRIDISMECTSEEEVSICIEASMLINALKELPEQPIIFTINKYNLSVNIDYSGGKFKMVGKEPTLFPTPKKISGDESTFQIDNIQFISGITNLSFCAANDVLRPVMNGVFVEIEKAHINFVATDGHRMGIVKHSSTGNEKQSFVLPTKTASILKSIKGLSDNIAVTVGDNNVVFQSGDYTITSILQEGRYPNYLSVIPSNNDKIVTVDTSLLKNALTRVGIFSNQVSNLIVFELSTDKMLIKAQDIDYSTNAEEIVECKYKGPNFTIGFKFSFMVEILSHIDCDRCTLSFSEPSRAILIKPEENETDCEITFLQMPLSINN